MNGRLKVKNKNEWASAHARLVFVTRNAWRLVWMQRKVVGRQLPWGSAMLLAVAAVIILDQSDQPRHHFQLVCELLLPLVGAVATAYLFGPDNDPPLELLYTCPCPISALLGARLVWLAGIIVLPTGLVQVLFCAAQSSLQPRELWLLFQIWATPTICLSGLGLLAAQLLRSAQAGVLAAAMVWILQVLILAQVFENQVLRSFYLFPIFAGLSIDDMLLKRWMLLGLGLIFFAVGFVMARDSQRPWTI